MSTLTIILLCLYIIPQCIGYYFLFEKADEAGWKGLIPIYNVVVLLKIVGRPWWWVLYMMIPLFGLFVAIGVYIDLAKSYGKHELKDFIAIVLIPFIYVPLMGINKDVRYEGPSAENEGKSVFREWTEAIGFAVIAATLIRWLIMEAYTIPTPSMENSLLVGDFLFVSKFHYGTRTTTTPLQVPLTHQKIWFTDLPSYTEWIELPQYRLPGFTSIKNEDVVVFNVPPTSLNDGIDYPVDLKTNYIKRCVAIAGDTIQVIDKQVYINGKAQANPERMQYSYIVKAKTEINDRIFEKYEISEHRIVGREEGLIVYQMQLRPELADELKKLSFVSSAEVGVELAMGRFGPREKGVPEFNIFPSAEKFPWNGDFFGPLVIPKKGMTIKLDENNLATYRTTIEKYDHNENVTVVDGKMSIDGKVVTEYTFKQNYYFMMGDNRHNSLDSRYWGFVPEDHVVGKAFFIWLSINNQGDLSDKIRWSRFFKMID